jgi:hypothetical protein
MLADRIFSEGRRNVGMAELKHSGDANDSTPFGDLGRDLLWN